MKHQSARELFRYWNRLRGKQPAPPRNALEPSEIRSLLGDTFLLEALPGDDYRFRLAGTRICSAYCRELKGQSFLDLWPQPDHAALLGLLTTITAEAAAGSLAVLAENERGQSVSLEILLLPLQHQDQFNRIVGLVVAETPPYWLGMHPIVRQKTVDLELFRPEREDTVIALPTAAVVPPPADRLRARRHGTFVVVQGGKG